MDRTYEMIDENTLWEMTGKSNSVGSGVGREKMTLYREFNFAARQMTVIQESSLHLNGYQARAGGVSSQMQVFNFRDIEGRNIIRQAHEKLVELGGSPPPIDEVLSNAQFVAKPGKF